MSMRLLNNAQNVASKAAALYNHYHFLYVNNRSINEISDRVVLLDRHYTDYHIVYIGMRL